MALQIEDGLGSGRVSGVSPQHRLMTAAETNVTAHFVSKETGRAFNWNSIDGAAAANDIIFYLLNTSATRNLFVDVMRVGAANAALWKVTIVTGTAAGSSAITGTNLNLGSGIQAEATSRGSGAITGLTAGTTIATARNAAGASTDIPFDDVLIIPPNVAIGVEYDTGTGGLAEVLVRGYYRVI